MALLRILPAVILHQHAGGAAEVVGVLDRARFDQVAHAVSRLNSNQVYRSTCSGLKRAPLNPSINPSGSPSLGR
jgi:hypothetical protein